MISDRIKLKRLILLKQLNRGFAMSNKNKKVTDKKKDRECDENRKNEKNKTRLMDKFSEMLELPKEIVLNVPKMTLIGNGDMIIENYKGIIECGETRIRINTGIGTIKMTGNRLVIREITSEDIIISGEIKILEFIV